MIKITRLDKENIRKIYCILYPEYLDNYDNEFWENIYQEAAINNGIIYKDEFVPFGDYLVQDRYGKKMFKNEASVKRFL